MVPCNNEVFEPEKTIERENNVKTSNKLYVPEKHTALTNELQSGPFIAYLAQNRLQLFVKAVFCE